MKNMKRQRVFLWTVTAFFALAMLFAFTACENIISLDSVEPLCAKEDATYEIGKFDYDDFTLLLTYSDGTTEYVPLTEDMLSEYDKLQLKSPGKHTLSVTYENKTVNFTVTVTLKQVTDDEKSDTVAPYLPENAVFTYDGLPHSVTVQGDVPEGATILYPDGNTFVNHGTYPVTATIKADGYDTLILHGQVTILQDTYDFDSFRLVADYGTEEDGSAKSSFVYDGAPHGVSIVGTYPAELGEPKLTIKSNTASAFVPGSTAIDAGTYTVRAEFSGDALNYTNAQYSYECKFVISPKPISQDVLRAIQFEDVTVDYDGKPHRIDIGNVQLPEGISVGYYEKDGKTPFGTRTDVNEEGYVVVCKFESDNPNLLIVDQKTARLRIMKVNYVNVNELHIGFLDESTAVTYDGTSHALKVFGLNKNVTVAKYVWQKSATEEVELQSLTDVLVDGDGNEQAYRITAYFNTPSDGNHNDIDPITADLRVMKASFNQPQYTFESVSAVYSEDETYALSYNEMYLPVGMQAVLSYTAPGSTEEISGVPSVLCLPYDAKNPKQNYGVGVYSCTLRFIYNKDNYVDAPDTISPVTQVLTISERTYDAKAIIGVEDVRTTYEPGVNRLTLCRFDEALPNWVSANYLTIARVQNANGEPEGDELFEAINAGSYRFFFRFSYFNGTSFVYADSESATLKIVGLKIQAKYYSITHGSAFTYDGVTDCLPLITATKDAEGKLITPDGLTYSVKYYYAKPGIDSYSLTPDYAKTFALTYVDTSIGEKCVLQIDQECLAKAKCAGSHKFEITVSGPNFEPLSVGFTLTVNPLEIKITPANWVVSSDPISVIYDGKSHGDMVKVTVNETDPKKKSIVLYAPKYVSSKTPVENPGIDVGEYTYTLAFSSSDVNYYVTAESEYNFAYTVTITPRDVKASAAGGTEDTSYQPFGFIYFNSYYNNDGSQTARDMYVDTAETKTYQSGDAVYEYAKLYGTKVTENEYSLSVCHIAFKDTEVWNPWFAFLDMEIYRIPTDTQTDDETRNEIRALINQTFADATLILCKDGNVVKTYTGVFASAKEQAMALDTKSAGTYTLLVVLPNGNILMDGSRLLTYYVTFNPLGPIIGEPTKAGTPLVKQTDETFQGFSSIANGEKLSAYKGEKMLVYETTADGNTARANLFKSANAYDQDHLKAAEKYIVRCDSAGNVLYGTDFRSVFDFNPATDAVARANDSAYTEAGHYYLFFNLGENIVYNYAGEQLHKYVIRIDVLANEISSENVVTLTSSKQTTLTQGTPRKYVTDAAQVKYAYGDQAAISGVDAVANTSAYNGKKVYTYQTVYDGSKLGLTLFKGVSSTLLSKMTYDCKVISYSFTNGGAALGSAYGVYEGTKLSYSDVSGKISALYSTAAAQSAEKTSVGLYYVFVTVNATDIVCEGGNSFVVTVKVDRDDSDSHYQYMWKNVTYDMRSTTLPYPKTTVEYYPDTAVPFDKAEALRAQLQTSQSVAVSFAGTLFMDMSGDFKNVIGTHDVTVTFLFDTERFGGYQIVVTAPIFEIQKQTFALSPLTALKDVYFYNPTVIDLTTVISDYRDEMQEKLENLGLSEADAATLADATHLKFRFNDGKNSYDSITDYGEYTVYPVFTLSKTEDLYLRYNFVTGTAFTATDSGLSVLITPNTVKFGNLSVKKAKIMMTEGYSVDWPSDFKNVSEFEDVQKVVDNTYAFIGFYTETGNDFKNSLATALTSAEITAFINAHVTVAPKSVYYNITLDLGDDAKYFDIWINYWEKTGETGNQAQGAINEEKSYRYTGTEEHDKTVYVVSLVSFRVH